MYAYGRAHVYVLVKLLGLEGRAVRVAWLVHGTEGDRYEVQPLVRAPSSCILAHISALLSSSRFFLSPFFYFSILTAISPLAFVWLFKSLSWQIPSRFRLVSNFISIVATAFVNTCVSRAFRSRRVQCWKLPSDTWRNKRLYFNKQNCHSFRKRQG